MPPMPRMLLPMQPRPPVISAPPQFSPARANLQARIPVISPSAMKVATTVFVGNISDKSSDTLLRQILLRCGRIEGWKRVQDASGKLQGFGFCEYGDPESTLRALRILHEFKLGDKNLVVKVDSKTRTDLLKYVMKKKRKADQETVDEAAIDREVEGMDEKRGTVVLKEVTDEQQKETDRQIITAITALVRENVEVLWDGTSRAAADAQLEQDVKEALFAIAKQKGKIDPNCTLDDMDMEEDMKTLVSDEIKKFRLSSELLSVVLVPGVPF
jgi:RNA-binding protein 25